MQQPCRNSAVLPDPSVKRFNVSSLSVSSSVDLCISTMTFLDTLRQWDEAVACVDKALMPQALQILVAIEEPNSKIYFNIGSLHLINNDFDAAEKVCSVMSVLSSHLPISRTQKNLALFLTYNDFGKVKYKLSIASFM